MLTVAQKIEHLKKLGFTGDLTEVEKFYLGQKFQQNDLNLQELIKFSIELWKEYSLILKKIPSTVGKEKTKLINRKEEIISTVFPKHGVICDIRDGFYCTICAVDFDQNSLTSINKNVKFGKYTLAELGDFALLGQDVKIGATFGADIQPNKKIIISDDTWICASTIIGVGTTVSRGTVLGIGACLYPGQKTEVNALVLGNPANTKLLINENYQSKKDNHTYRSTFEIEQIVNHVNNLGLDVDDAFINALKGEKYNCASPCMAKITDFSHNLSCEFNNPSTTDKRRHEIIDILFPLKGKNFKIGQGLFVDVLGLAKIGENVQVGDNAFFAGNITIGDNVCIGVNSVFAGIGHGLPAHGRRFRNFQGAYGEVCEVGKIQIANNVDVGNDCTFAPGAVLTQNLPSRCYIIGKDKIFEKVRLDKLVNEFMIER